MGRKPSYGSLFSGAGGFDMGFDAAGFTCSWQVEIDPTARDVLARHWPDVPKFEDVRECGKRNLAPVDVVVGGFPCQNLSNAGNREGLAGEKSGLWWEMHRVIGELRPRFVVWENVPGLFSSDDGRDLRRVVSSLAELGYFGAWRTLDSEHAGVPQLRRRVFGVFATGLPGKRGRLAQSPSREDGRRLAGLCAAVLALTDVPEGHPEACKKARKKAAAAAGKRADVVGTLTAGSHPGGHDDVSALKATFGKSRAGVDEAQGNQLVFGGNNTSGPRPAASALNAGKANRQDFETENFVVYQCHGSNVGPAGTQRAGPVSAAAGVPFIVNAAGSCATTDHARETDRARCLDSNPFAQGQGGTVIVFKSGDATPKGREGAAYTITHRAGRGHGDGDGLAVAVFNPQAGGKQTTLGLSTEGTDGALCGSQKPAVAIPITADAAAGRTGDADAPSADAAGNIRLRPPGLGVGEPGDAMFTLSAAAVPAVALAENQQGELRTSATAPAQSRGGGKPGQGFAAAFDGADVRRLTPLEYERLMGWPDGWTEFRANGKRIADGPRYRMCGNGVVRQVAEWLACRLAAAVVAANFAPARAGVGG